MERPVTFLYAIYFRKDTVHLLQPYICAFWLGSKEIQNFLQFWLTGLKALTLQNFTHILMYIGYSFHVPDRHDSPDTLIKHLKKATNDLTQDIH